MQLIYNREASIEKIKFINMKLSKSILTAVVVGASILGSTTSCEKEEMEMHESEREEARPFCGTGEPEIYPEDCPACGLG